MVTIRVRNDRGEYYYWSGDSFIPEEIPSQHPAWMEVTISDEAHDILQGWARQNSLSIVVVSRSND